MEQNRRLIDADERADLIRCLKKYHDASFTPGTYEHSVFGKAALLLEKTANAVEVVRCKDCSFGYGDLICTNPKCVKSWCGCPVSPEHFCSYGERRETMRHNDNRRRVRVFRRRKKPPVITKVETNCFDKEEIFENCTVQVLTNTKTGEVSVGWWKNEGGK